MPEHFLRKSALVLLSIFVGVLLYMQKDIANWLRTDVLVADSSAETSVAAEPVALGVLVTPTAPSGGLIAVADPQPSTTVPEPAPEPVSASDAKTLKQDVKDEIKKEMTKEATLETKQEAKEIVPPSPAQPAFDLPTSFVVTPPSDTGKKSADQPAPAVMDTPVQPAPAVIVSGGSSPAQSTPSPIITDVSLFESFDNALHPLVQKLKALLGMSSENEKEYYTKLTLHTIELTGRIDEQTKQVQDTIAFLNTTYGRETQNACMRVQYYSYLATDKICILVNEDVCSSAAITDINQFNDKLSCERANGIIVESSSRDQGLFFEQKSAYLNKLALLDKKYSYFNTVWEQLITLAKTAKDFDDLGAAGNQINEYRIQQGKELTQEPAVEATMEASL